MSWSGGPTYGMWADTVEEIDEAYASLAQVKKNRDDWKKYAKKLEESLAEVSDMYRSKVGDERAQARLKRLALDELKQFDPSNKLFDPEYRRQIGSQVRMETAKELAEGEKS